MDNLAKIKAYENIIYNDKISTVEFDAYVRAIENLTAEWVENTAPLPKPAKFCRKMNELESIYGLHLNRSIF